jgi:hypothetical protein
MDMFIGLGLSPPHTCGASGRGDGDASNMNIHFMVAIDNAGPKSGFALGQGRTAVVTICAYAKVNRLYS